MDLCKRGDLETLRFHFVILLVHRVCLQTERCDNLILQPLFLLDRGLFVTVSESFLAAEIEAHREAKVWGQWLPEWSPHGLHPFEELRL